ncbi:Mitochondrial import receptor subunit TOM20 like, partial [Pseudolycoriella hygida]
IAAGVAGTLFLGYCIYFDKKRRSDPDYKKKIRERRRRQRKIGSSGSRNEIPNLRDQEAVQ